MAEIIDVTYLIDDDFPRPEPVHRHVDLYNEGIPKMRAAYRLFNDKIAADVMSACDCKNKCGERLMKDPFILMRIQHWRSNYYSCKQGEARTNKTLDLLRSSIVGDLKCKTFVFEGTLICLRKWLDILGISKATYYRAMVYVQKGLYTATTIRKQTHSNVRGLDARGFIHITLKKYGDFSPEKEKILMPPCVTRKFIYDEYLELTPGPHLNIKHFYRIFKENFGNTVSFAKNTNINPCDICLRAKDELYKNISAEDKQRLKDDLKIHLDRQYKERQDYYSKKEEALTRPSEVLSIIIDGMDQAKTSLPHFRGWCRPKSAALAVKTHITGTIVHGKGNHFFIDLQQWPHDPNLTITCIVDSICQYESYLPPKLYVQCDNCGRENKNKYVLAFLAYLCLAGYVKEVYLSFLLKGHTHEDIDQKFSVISQHMKGVNAKTLPQLESAILGSFRTQPNVKTLSQVWDVKAWIGDYVNDIQNHSFPHQFWMFCDRPDHVALKTRMWSTDEWLPDDSSEQLELLVLDLEGNQTLPTGLPGIVLPNFQSKMNISQVKSLIEKMKAHLSFEENAWWQDFISNPDSVCRNRNSWPLLRLQRVHKFEDIPATVEPGSTCISELVDVEGTLRTVTTKRRRRLDEQ